MNDDGIGESESKYKKLQWIFPTTGHAGSTFVCKLLLRAGYKCGHEDVYQAIRDGIQLVRNPAFTTHSLGYDAESSVFCVPFLRTAFAMEAKCIHIVREPWKIIRSWERSLGGIGISRFFNQWIDIYEMWPWNYPLYTTGRRDTTWLAGVLVSWNRLIRKLRPESPLCKIEAYDHLIQCIGIDYSGEPPDVKTNSKVDHEMPYQFSLTNDAIKRGLYEWTEECGYETEALSSRIA